MQGAATARKTAAVCAATVLAALVATAGPADAQRRLRGQDQTARDRAPAPPAGPHLFIVSLQDQRASLYANGELIAHAPVSTGTASHPTPTGVFSVIQKNRHHRSNIYSGAPMPFMQRLTWSGIALHQGQLPGYPASHGCIRLPGDFAHFLWRTTKLGARVIVSPSATEPVEITHSRLFQPQTAPVAATPPVLPETPALRRSIEADIAANTAAATTTDAETLAAAAASATNGRTATGEGVAATDLSAAATQAAIPAPILASFFETLEAKVKKAAPAGPISIFISRKDGQLYVRQGFQALFNVPLALRDEKTSIGTHVFTALDKTDGTPGLRWLAISVPEYGRAERMRRPEPAIISYRYDDFGRRVPMRARRAASAQPATPIPPASVSAAAALDRIDLPQDLVERVSAYVTAGATLIVSDHGLGHETGAYTDFIVLTH
jgi:hypothetical protein